MHEAFTHTEQPRLVDAMDLSGKESAAKNMQDFLYTLNVLREQNANAYGQQQQNGCHANNGECCNEIPMECCENTEIRDFDAGDAMDGNECEVQYQCGWNPDAHHDEVVFTDTATYPIVANAEYFEEVQNYDIDEGQFDGYPPSSTQFVEEMETEAAAEDEPFQRPIYEEYNNVAAESGYELHSNVANYDIESSNASMEGNYQPTVQQIDDGLIAGNPFVATPLNFSVPTIAIHQNLPNGAILSKIVESITTTTIVRFALPTAAGHHDAFYELQYANNTTTQQFGSTINITINNMYEREIDPRISQQLGEEEEEEGGEEEEGDEEEEEEEEEGEEEEEDDEEEEEEEQEDEEDSQQTEEQIYPQYPQQGVEEDPTEEDPTEEDPTEEDLEVAAYTELAGNW